MIRLFWLAVLVMGVDSAFAQKKVYSTSGGELIFSWANVNDGVEHGSIVRFSPVFNFQSFLHFDKSDKFGVFTGIAVRNVGFIYDVPNTGYRKKYRTYNLGIPVALKFGNLNGVYFYGGYELEIPFNYKEKTFLNEDKQDKFNVWFSGRTPAIYSSLFFGVELPYGTNLKFKYYLTNFFDKGYSEIDASGNPSQPYAGIDVNVFYFSISTIVFRGTKFNDFSNSSSPGSTKLSRR